MKALKQAEKADLIRIAFEERELGNYSIHDNYFWFGEIECRWMAGYQCEVRTVYRVLDEGEELTDDEIRLDHIEIREIGFYKIACWAEIDVIDD